MVSGTWCLLFVSVMPRTSTQGMRKGEKWDLGQENLSITITTLIWTTRSRNTVEENGDAHISSKDNVTEGLQVGTAKLVYWGECKVGKGNGGKVNLQSPLPLVVFLKFCFLHNAMDVMIHLFSCLFNLHTHFHPSYSLFVLFGLNFYWILL